MRSFYQLLIFCLVVLHTLVFSPVLAEAACVDCAERYVELAESKRLQAQIDYLQPGDELDLDTTKKSRAEEAEGDPADGGGDNVFDFGQVGFLLISGMILAGLGFIIYQNSTGGLVAFGSQPQDAAKPAVRQNAQAKTRGGDDGLPKSEAAFLAEIEGMEDRRLALHLLVGRLLANASEKSGIRPGRSWTARESLRALPRNWVHLADLRQLNRHAELAWFGGRHVDDGVFDDCIGRARQMMRGAAAR